MRIMGLLETKKCLTPDDRIALRHDILDMRPKHAESVLTKFIGLVTDTDTAWCPIYLRRRLCLTLDYGSVIDDLCDRVSHHCTSELRDWWTKNDSLRKLERDQHMQNIQAWKRYQHIRSSILEGCKLSFDTQILHLTYPEIMWENVSSYPRQVWSAFQPGKMPNNLRSAFVYATRNVPMCRDQNDEWIHAKMSKRMRWWRGYKSLPYVAFVAT